MRCNPQRRRRTPRFTLRQNGVVLVAALGVLGVAGPVLQQRLPFAATSCADDRIPREDASDLRTLTTPEAAKLAARVVLAHCRKVTVRQTEAGIFTFTDFDVVRTLKGSFPKTSLTLRLLGGALHDKVVDAPFMPSFTSGADVVLFLGADNADGFPTIFPQAVFEVVTDPGSGQRIVRPSPTSLTIYRKSDGSAHPTLPAPVTLEDFLYSLERLFGQ